MTAGAVYVLGKLPFTVAVASWARHDWPLFGVAALGLAIVIGGGILLDLTAISSFTRFQMAARRGEWAWALGALLVGLVLIATETITLTSVFLELDPLAIPGGPALVLHLAMPLFIARAIDVPFCVGYLVIGVLPLITQRQDLKHETAAFAGGVVQAMNQDLLTVQEVPDRATAVAVRRTFSGIFRWATGDTDPKAEEEDAKLDSLLRELHGTVAQVTLPPARIVQADALPAPAPAQWLPGPASRGLTKEVIPNKPSHPGEEVEEWEDSPAGRNFYMPAMPALNGRTPQNAVTTTTPRPTTWERHQPATRGNLALIEDVEEEPTQVPAELRRKQRTKIPHGRAHADQGETREAKHRRLEKSMEIGLKLLKAGNAPLAPTRLAKEIARILRERGEFRGCSSQTATWVIAQYRQEEKHRRDKANGILDGTRIARPLAPLTPEQLDDLQPPTRYDSSILVRDSAAHEAQHQW